MRKYSHHYLFLVTKLFNHTSMFSIGNTFDDEGKTLDLWAVGSMMFELCITVSTLKVFIISYDHSIMSIFFLMGSIVAYYITFLLTSTFDFSQVYMLFIP